MRGLAAAHVRSPYGTSTDFNTKLLSYLTSCLFIILVGAVCGLHVFALHVQLNIPVSLTPLKHPPFIYIQTHYINMFTLVLLNLVHSFTQV
jgi:hypothetical protein